MNLYLATVPQFKRILQNLERWLDKTAALAEGKKFDPIAARARWRPQLRCTANQSVLTK